MISLIIWISLINLNKLTLKAELFNPRLVNPYELVFFKHTFWDSNKVHINEVNSLKEHVHKWRLL